MKNLKRALSLVLATVMVIGMMVVGASAAGYNDFADRDEIVNKDAVSMLTTLKVIEGDGTGNFRPEGTFTREAMAKMISVIMNKGVNNNDLFLGANSGLLDLDQAGDWAKGHINYCYTVGMIAGDGAGHFFPQAKLTAVAAAKMLLVAIGYNPEIEGLVGEQWDIKTAALAAKLGIFDGYTKSVNAVLSRDDAALLIYNAMDVEMIAGYTNGKYPETFKDGRTILSTMYGVYKIEGVVVANEWAALNETDSDATIKAGKTTLSNVVSYESNTINTTRPEGVELKGQHTFNFTSEASDLGKTVTLFVRKTTILANSEVLGYAVKDDVNDIVATVASATSLKSFLKGTGLVVTKDTEVYVNYGIVDAERAPFNGNGVKVEVIDNNNDGDVDYILYTEETLSIVTKYSEKNETITVRDMNNGKAMSFDDVVFADDVVDGDFVLFVEYGGRAYVSAPEIVTGTMTRVDRDKASELYVTIEGDTYKQSTIPNKLDGSEAKAFNINGAKALFGTKIAYILDTAGYIVAYTEPAAAAPNYALVTGSAWSQNAKVRMGQVEILMSDGTSGLYDVNWKASVGTGKEFANDKALEDYLGTRDVLGGKNVDAAAGTVIKYTLNEDDELTIKAVLKLDDKTTDAYAGGSKFNLNHKVSDNGGADRDTSYETGDASLYVTDNATDTEIKYAIDLDTIAFYYKPASDVAAAAIGYNNMYDVAEGTSVQVYTTTEGGKLVEVVVFNAAVSDTAKDYLYILSANALTKGAYELNVVFQDGTVETIVVDEDNVHGLDLDDDDAYDTIAAYSVRDDEYSLYNVNPSTLIVNSYAHLVKNGTIVVNADADATNNVGDYYTVTKDSAVWNVTDMTGIADGETAVEGRFLKNEVVEINAIYDNDKNTIVAAWIIDYEEGAQLPTDDLKPYTSYTTWVDEDDDSFIMFYNVAKNKTEMLNKITATVRDDLALGNGDKVTVTVTGTTVKAAVELTSGAVAEYTYTLKEAHFVKVAAYNVADSFYTDASAGYTGHDGKVTLDVTATAQGKGTFGGNCPLSLTVKNDKTSGTATKAATDLTSDTTRVVSFTLTPSGDATYTVTSHAFS